ncbi:MAG: hypothetical protein J6N53_17285 [Lachnospiraceae bacterium]|nr:hypothetical protein [Lachnospiraceae bacterium]MBP3295070.1 hypothetical protein [Lachnospiraceae bacterium]
MATSTILEPIRVNDEHGAEVVVEALENAENIRYRRNAERPVVLTTDPDTIRKVAEKAMAGVRRT